MYKYKDDSHRKIGFFSYQKGAGVTHLALTYAAYFSSVKGEKVWVFEVGNQHTLENLEDYLRTRSCGEGGIFQGDRITFFPNLSVEKAIELISHAPEILILDFGAMEREKEVLLHLCEERILVCDFSPWKRGDILRTLLWKKQEKRVLWNRCVSYLGRAYIKWAKRRLGEEIEPLPEIGNPFCIKRQEVKDLGKLCQIRY